MSPVTRNRIQLAIIAMLLVVIAALAYKFIVAGSVEQGSDGRVAIVLELGERDFVLREMRGFVAGLHKLTGALARDDMKAAAAAARGMGMSEAHGAPSEIVGKLPIAFKALAFATHGEFDALAADAESLGDAKHSLTQLSGVLSKCVECHERYQFKTPSGG